MVEARGQGSEHDQQRGHRCTWLCPPETARALLAGDPEVTRRLWMELTRRAQEFNRYRRPAWWPPVHADDLAECGVRAIKRCLAKSKYDWQRCFQPLALRYFYTEARHFHRKAVPGYDSARKGCDRQRRLLTGLLDTPAAGEAAHRHWQALLEVKTGCAGESDRQTRRRTNLQLHGGDTDPGVGIWETAYHNPELDGVLKRIAADGALPAAAHAAAEGLLLRMHLLRRTVAIYRADGHDWEQLEPFIAA